jgi:hypothetical protein
MLIQFWFYIDGHARLKIIFKCLNQCKFHQRNLTVLNNLLQVTVNASFLGVNFMYQMSSQLKFGKWL